MELRFNIGINVFLERRVGDSKVKCATRVIGQHPPNYLLLDLPQQGGLNVFGSVEGKCIVRYLQEGTMVGFRASITRILTDPFPMLILQYPQSVEELVLRKAERIDCNLQSLLTLPPPTPQPGAEASSDSPTIEASVIDLGLGGIQCVVQILETENPTKEMLALRAKVPVAERKFYHADYLMEAAKPDVQIKAMLLLPEPASKRRHSVNCEVRWCKRIKDTMFLGMRFVDPPEVLTENIQQLIDYQTRFFTRHYEQVQH